MSDSLIFAVLFATYGVLGASLAGGPGPRDLFELPLVALNTTLLLISSITYGFAMLAMNVGDQKKTAAVARRSPVSSARPSSRSNSTSSPISSTAARDRSARASCRPSSRSSARTGCT